MQKQKYKKSKKRILAVALSVVIVIGLGLFLFQDPLGIFGKSKTDDGINYDPPTKQEKQAVDEHKEAIITTPQGEPEPSNNNSNGPREVSPFITIAQQFNDSQYGNRVEVRAYIPEIIEFGGNCNFTFTKGSEHVTWKVEGQPDARTTVCDVAMVSRDKFPSAGTWSVVVAYESNTARGVSDAVDVEVQ
jgi:hypothetical protein